MKKLLDLFNVDRRLWAKAWKAHKENFKYELGHIMEGMLLPVIIPFNNPKHF